MNNAVRVTGDKAGNIITPSEGNAEYGYIRVEQTRMVIDDNGWARKKTISALIPGTIADLKSFGWKAGDTVPGKVLVQESLTPFSKKDPERDYKIAGKTQIVCCLDGQPIYRKTMYSQSAEAEDVTIKHNNVEAIREAHEKLKVAETADLNQG